MRKRRFLGILLTLALLLTLLPGLSMTAYAATSPTFKIAVKDRRYGDTKTYKSKTALPLTITGNALQKLFNYNGKTTKITRKSGTNVTVSGTSIKVSGAGTSRIWIYENSYYVDFDIVVTVVSKGDNPLTYAETQTVEKDFSASAQTATLTAAEKGQGAVTYAIQSQKDSADADVTCFSLNGTTLNIAENTPLGTYTVVVRATAAGNNAYNSGYKDSTVTVTVSPASITPTVSLEGWTFGETAKEPSVTGNTGNSAVTYRYKAKDAEDSEYSETVPTEAGEYTVKATVAETANYNGGTATADFTISRAEAGITAPTAKTLTNIGSEQELVNAGSTNDGTLYYAVTTENVAPTDDNLYTTSIPTATDAGTYYVWYRVVGDANHNDTQPDCVPVELSPAAASTGYGDHLVNGTDTATTLADKVVKFNGVEWYIIADDSTAVDAGTVTLLAKDPIVASKFHDSSDAYSTSTVKTYLDNLTGTSGSYADVADAIKTVKVKGSDSDTEVDAKLWLLSTTEANALPEAARKCAKAEGAWEQSWWLRTPNGSYSPYAAYVNGANGVVTASGRSVSAMLGVRPALQLDLSKVTFDTATNTFSVAAATEPTITGYALELTGTLGLRYYMALPTDAAFDYSESTMTFSMNQREDQVFTLDEITQGEYFTCDVYAYQMADTITATFTYKQNEETKTLTDTYSVKQYLDELKDGDYSGEALALVNATRAYGHFVQPYLARLNGWTVGEKYAAMDYAGTVNVAEAASGAANYPHNVSMTEAVKSAQYRLMLNADTSMFVEVRLKEAPAGTVTMTVGGKTRTPTVSGKAYRVEISDIPAFFLGRNFAVALKDGDTTVFDFTASPMSYVRTVLNQGGAPEDEQQALAALYHYYMAADAYAKSMSN